VTSSLVAALTEELAGTLGALVGADVSLTPGERVVAGDAWVVTIETDVAARGKWTILVDGPGAEVVTAATMGIERPVPAPAVADCWREALAQVLSALGVKDVSQGAVFRLSGLEAEATAKPVDPYESFEVRWPELNAPIGITVCGGIDVTVSAPAPRAAAGASSASAQSAQTLSAQTSTQTLPAQNGGSMASPRQEAAPGTDRLDAILDIELPLIVRFGRTELPLRALTHLGPGSLIDLGRSADDPVDLLVSNRIVARGEVVVVGGNYGVRVLDVVSPRDRARTMEG
jgi:flagellar motor switch protein FliN